MSEQNMEQKPESLIVTMSDATNLPIYHVNAMNLRGSVDEFFFTLGVVQPPDRTELSAIKETGNIQAQPIFRFAISHFTEVTKPITVRKITIFQATRVIDLEEGKAPPRR